MKLRGPQIITIAAAALAIAAVAIVAFLYYTHDPSSPVAPKCVFRLLTGWDCPGCGAQRALHAMLHGRIAEAWGYNPYLFFAFPAAVAFIVIEAGRSSWPRLYRDAINEATISVVLITTVAWWVFRNL